MNLLRHEIIEQSDRFNKDRAFDPTAYGSRDLSILAYGNFYFSRTWMVAAFALSETLTRCRWKLPKKGPIRILDLGSGSGASGLSCLFFMRRFGISNPIEVHAWDYSGKSLTYLKNLHRERSELWPNSKLVSDRVDLRFSLQEKKDLKFDLIFLGFSFNEILQDQDPRITTSWLQSVCDQLKTNGRLVLTEPAEPEICRKLHQTTAALSTENENLSHWAPYLNGFACPMTANASKYFSHEVRTSSPLSTVERINRPLGLEIRQVKFGLAILGLETPPAVMESPDFFRLISPVKKRKGTLSFLGMAADGKEYRYEFQRRDLEKEQLKDLLRMERGDVVRSQKQLTANEAGRVRFGKDDRIDLIFAPRILPSEADRSPTALLGD